jgi:hypothetical protein
MPFVLNEYFTLLDNEIYRHRKDLEERKEKNKIVTEEIKKRLNGG